MDDLLKDPEDETNVYSVEFCGGTHLTNTRDAVAFAIVAEEPLAAGVRRIAVVTGDDAQRAINNVLPLRERVSLLLVNFVVCLFWFIYI